MSSNFKKSLGQHFLKSEKALSSIVEAGKISKDDLILEIGPGSGILTEKLLQTGAKVIGVEKDDELFEILEEKFKGKNAEFIHQDILHFDISKYSTNYKVIANIPYNITGAILQKFLSGQNPPKLMVLLVQKEVAERIVARDGKESILSISVKAYGTPRYIERVLAGSFVPPPRVDSAIISIEGITKYFFEGFSEKEFFRMVKAGFRSKRKKLLSNLGELFGKNEVRKAFEILNLPEFSRAEEIPVEIWQKLAQILLPK